VLPTWGPSGRGTARKPYFRWPGSTLTLAAVPRVSETTVIVDGWTSTLFAHLPNRSRHAGGLNAGFVDGHARWMTHGRFWEVKADEYGFHWLRHASADR
jgi:prepilin-type processing-associated H-X9-DG protein